MTGSGASIAIGAAEITWGPTVRLSPVRVIIHEDEDVRAPTAETVERDAGKDGAE